MEVKVYKRDGSESGEIISLNKDIFGIEPNDHAIYLDVKAIRAAQRQGNHKVKSRSEVRGGGKKPYRQKGTGGARRGTNRSPLMPGGGAIFGPRPHDYDLKVNKKVKALARKSALTYKAKENAIVVLEDFTPEAVKTKPISELLKKLGLGEKKTLLLTPGHDEVLYRSGRNINTLFVLEAKNASTYDILDSRVIVMQKGAVKVLEEQLSQ